MEKTIAECPKCGEIKELHCPYDTFYIPESKQEKWCEDCISDAAEDEDQRKFERYHGG